MNVNEKGVEGAGENNHIQDVCADRYKISMHTFSFTLGPEVLLGGNLIAVVLSAGKLCGSIGRQKKRRKILQQEGSFHLARSAER